MKQALTPEDINFLKEKIAPWNVIEDNHVETAWVVPCTDGNHPITLFDYNNRDQNKADAYFTLL